MTRQMSGPAGQDERVTYRSVLSLAVATRKYIGKNIIEQGKHVTLFFSCICPHFNDCLSQTGYSYICRGFHFFSLSLRIAPKLV